MLADIVVRPEVEGRLHRTSVTLAEERFDVLLKAERLVVCGCLHSIHLLGLRGGGGDAGARRRVTHPPPTRYGHMHWRLRSRGRVLDGDARAPLEVGNECGTELGVAWETGFVGALTHELYPPGSLSLVSALPGCCDTIQS